MYTDFRKYNYDLVPEAERAAYIERDKKAFGKIISQRFEADLEDIVERTWEIADIYFLDKTNDFVKLLREAESSYGMGHFRSCIALSGMATEDLSKHLSEKAGKAELLGTGQGERLKKLYEDGNITCDSYALLDQIRKIRNNCIHHDNEFKLKAEEELKSDAISSLNNLKKILKLVFGEVPIKDPNDFAKMLEPVMNELDPKDKDELTLMVRNACSHLFNMAFAFEPDKKESIIESVFRILEADFDKGEFGELALQDLRSDILPPVVIDLDEKSRQEVSDLSVGVGDVIEATIHSKINEFGLSSTWRFDAIGKA